MPNFVLDGRAKKLLTLKRADSNKKNFAGSALVCISIVNLLLY